MSRKYGSLQIFCHSLVNAPLSVSEEVRLFSSSNGSPLTCAVVNANAICVHNDNVGSTPVKLNLARIHNSYSMLFFDVGQ